MDEKYFEELRFLYVDFKKNYEARVEKQRKKTYTQIKTKGRIYDVFPYHAEQYGYKTKGKVVDEIEMKDDNFIYYFDENDRIKLIEEACTSLKRIREYTCYEYIDNKIYEYHANFVGPRRISIGLYEDNKLMEKYTVYSLERCAYEQYIYKDDLLCYIDTYVYEERKQPRQWKLKFYFDQKSNLKLIQRVEGLWRENRYNAVKISNKKLETVMEYQLMELWKDVQCYVNNMETPVIGVSLNLENDVSDIEFYFEMNGKTQILDKKYNVQIRDLPLDEDEKEKIVNIVLKTMVRLWDEKSLDEQVGLKITKGEINILKEENALPNWVKRNPQVQVGVETIRYQHLDENQKLKEKRIKEIFKDLTKSTDKKKSLIELVDCFEAVSKVVAKDANYEFLEDMFLLQAEVVTYKDRLMFGFSLIRQIPYKEEFVQLGIEVIYELNSANKLVSHSCWNETVEGDFFTYVRNTDVYKLGCKDPVYDVRLFLNET